jgi:transcriptional regulator with XRE-family HTH domain
MKKAKVVSPSLHRELTAYMDREGLTVRQMSDLLGLSYNYLRRVINGELFPRRQTVLEICKKTGIDFKNVWSAILQEKVAQQKSIDPFPWTEDPETGTASMTIDQKAYRQKYKRDPYLERLGLMFGGRILNDNDKGAIVNFAELIANHHEEARKLDAAPTEAPTGFGDPSEND